MIQFKNKTVKIIFYIIFGLLTLLFTFMVIMAYLDPSPTMNLLVLITSMFFTLLLPSLLMVTLFTRPTPKKKNPAKKVRMGKWLPTGVFIFLSGLSVLLLSIGSGNRCEDIQAGGQLWDCDFTGMDLSGRDLHGTNMQGINLSNSNLSGTDLSGSKLNGADLLEANLSNANLGNAVLIMGNLEGADLTGANLEGANLKWASLVGVGGLSEESLAHLGDWRAMQLEGEEEMFAALLPVCDGKAVEKAADYNSGGFANSMMMITAEGEIHDLSGVEGVWDTYWLPESVSNTELVACFSEEKPIGVGTCTYDDGTSSKQYMLQLEIDLYAAKTGQLLETISLNGTRPDDCPEKKVADAESRDFYGDAPYGKAILEALRPFINEDAELPPLNLP